MSLISSLRNCSLTVALSIVMGVCQAEEFGSTGVTKEEYLYWKESAYQAIEASDHRAQLKLALDAKYPDGTGPEFIRMLQSIINGDRMGPSDGWFGPGASLYDWQWMSQRHGIQPTETIQSSTFLGTSKSFEILDRDGDGEISADDFDWSDKSTWVKENRLLREFYRAIDQGGDNRIDSADWNQYFDRLRGKTPSVAFKDFRNARLRQSSSFSSGDAPTLEKLLRGLFENEIGSVHQGPNVGDHAPDFALKTHDGTNEIKLSSQYALKPVVLVFGNFTCGPFRRSLPEIEDLHQQYQDDVIFLGVYVREAHPTDGWSMESNSKQGVVIAQPTTYSQRVDAAEQCFAKLNYSMPLLVDEISDTVGNLYSGMPSRLYVIGMDGRVMYKSGRGPYGFNPDELEQALVTTLLNAEAN